MRRSGMSIALAPLMSGTITLGASPAVAQVDRPSDWRAEKCARYTKSWTDTLAKRGPRGLGQEFLDSHAAFLASGCMAPAAVCPRSAEELALANVMVILSMNQGMASTFAPFACRK